LRIRCGGSDVKGTDNAGRWCCVLRAGRFSPGELADLPVVGRFVVLLGSVLLAHASIVPYSPVFGLFPAGKENPGIADHGPSGAAWNVTPCLVRRSPKAQSRRRK